MINLKCLSFENILFKEEINIRLLLSDNVLMTLNKLTFSSCKIKSFDTSIFQTTPINSLNLSGNLDFDLTSFHRPLYNLNQLYLSQCNIKNTKLLALTLSFMVNLEIVDLSLNFFEEINENLFCLLKNLKSLDLSNCNISEISVNSFSKNINLEKLNLIHNKIIILQHDHFKDLINLRELNISFNPCKLSPHDLSISTHIVSTVC